MDRYQKGIRFLTKSAEQIKADPTIPENLKEALLSINRFLRSKVKRYDEARKILRSPYRRPGDLLARTHAKWQMRDIEALVGVFRAVMDESSRKKISATGR